MADDDHRFNDLLGEVAKEAHKANMRLDGHEDKCGERFDNLWRAINELKAMILAQGSDLHERMNTITHSMEARISSVAQNNDARLSVISTRMWSLLTACLGSVVLGLGALCFYLITKQMH